MQTITTHDDNRDEIRRRSRWLLIAAFLLGVGVADDLLGASEWVALIAFSGAVLASAWSRAGSRRDVLEAALILVAAAALAEAVRLLLL